MNSEIQNHTILKENIPSERKAALKTLGYYFLFFIVGMNLLILLGAIWGGLIGGLLGYPSYDKIENIINDVSTYLDPIFGILSIWWLYYYTKKNGLLIPRKVQIRFIDLLFILIAFIALMYSGVILDLIFHYFHFPTSTPDNQKEVEKLLVSNPIIMATSAVIIAPIKEEWITRKLIIGSIFNKLPIIGLFVSSLGFGALHMLAGFSIYALIQYSLAGFILGLLYIKTKRIEISILAHFINNFVSIASFFITSH